MAEAKSLNDAARPRHQIPASNVRQKATAVRTFADNRPAAAAQRKLITAISRPRPVTQAMSRVVQRAPIDLSGAQNIKPGPPPTLRLDGYFFKVFNQKNQAQQMCDDWDSADQEGVLTPRHDVKQVTHNNATRWAFRSKAANGTFFQFSKAGHTARVTGWIGKQTGKILLGRLRKVFSYVRTNIGDGQGFFEDSDGGDIKFIDINLNGTSPNAQQVVTAIDERLEQL